MGWLNKSAAAAAVDGLNKTLKVVDGMTTSQEEKSEMRKQVALATIDAHSAIVMAELNSGTYLARSWRPILGLTFGGVVAVTFIATLAGAAEPSPGMWDTVKWVLGGLIGFRSIDKGLNQVAPTYSARQLRKLKKAGVDVE